MKLKNSINQEKCKKCKLCIEVCPVNIIGIDDKNEVHFIKERESICLKCGQCMAICSTEAINVNGFSYDNDFFALPENKVDYKNFIDFLANRRSVRNFKDKPVPDDLIHQILEVLSFAPFGAEPEKVNITVINNRKKIETALPAIIIFHAPKGAEEHTNNSLIYATYSMLAAHSLGLGATIIGIVPAAINKVKEVREVFQIPEENEAIMSVIIGYPKYKYRKSIKRRGQNINWMK